MESLCLAPGGPHTGPNPTDRGKFGSKRYVVTDRAGIPQVFCVTGVRQHDSVVFKELLGDLPAVRGLQAGHGVGPSACTLTRALASIAVVFHLKRRGIQNRIARRGIERNDRFGCHRWGVEQTQAWLAAFGKLRVRFERSIQTNLALLSSA